MWACIEGHTAPVELLLAAKANVDHADGEGGTALSAASANHHNELVEILESWPLPPVRMAEYDVMPNSLGDDVMPNYFRRKKFDEEEEEQESNFRRKNMTKKKKPEEEYYEEEYYEEEFYEEEFVPAAPGTWVSSCRFDLMFQFPWETMENNKQVAVT